MIVKVQMPVITNEVPPKCLIYDKNRTFEELVIISDELIDAMGERKKAFFYAEIDEEDGTISLQAEAEWQNW